MQLDRQILIGEIRKFLNSTEFYMKEFLQLNKTNNLEKQKNDLYALLMKGTKLTDA